MRLINLSLLLRTVSKEKSSFSLAFELDFLTDSLIVAHTPGRVVVLRCFGAGWSSQPGARLTSALPRERLSLRMALLAKQVLEYESVLTRPEHLAASRASRADVSAVLDGFRYAHGRTL